MQSLQKKSKFSIGIDEAGRGPLAGPVVVGGVLIKNHRRAARLFRGVKDSKKLSAKQRETWFKKLRGSLDIVCARAVIPAKTIDAINIAQATNLGARRVYAKLAGFGMLRAALDGSLYLSKKIPHQTIIKGDEKVPLISAASIIAKVTRDRIMLRLHKKYPKYRFDLHKGYGTKLHRSRIEKYGRSAVHRMSFHLLTTK